MARRKHRKMAAVAGAALALTAAIVTAQPPEIPDIPIFVTSPKQTSGNAKQDEKSPPAPPPNKPRHDAPSNTVAPGPPAGFESLAEEQTTLVDLYYGNRQIGSVMARFDSREVELLDPAAVAAQVPWLTSKQDVSAALAGKREIRSEADCDNDTATRCALTTPTVADYGFDPERFRVDLFINPRFIERIDIGTDGYLDDPPDGLSSLHTLDLLLSRDDDSRYGALTDNSIVALGRSRLITRMTAEDERGFTLDTLRFEHDLQRWTWSAGTMNLTAQVSPLLSTRPFLGLRAARTLKMRHNLKLVRSSPIFVYLDERSRIDILRDGKLLSSGFYDPGNRRLDTTALPDGTYEVVVRISNSRGSREQRHLFTRSVLIPPADHALHFIEAGTLLERDTPSADATTPRTTDTDLLRAGSRFRLRNNIGAELDTTLITDFEATTQAGLYYFLPRFSLHGGLLGGWQHSAGGYLTMNWRTPRFNLNISHQTLTQTMEDDTAAHPLLVDDRKSDLTVGTSVGSGALVARVSRRRDDTDARTDYSMRYSRPLLRRGPSQLTMNLNWNRVDDDERLLLNLQYATNEKRLKQSLATSWREGGEADGNGLEIDAQIMGNHYQDGRLTSRSRLSARSTEQSRTLGLRLEHDFPQASAYLESRFTEEQDERSSIYTAGAHVTISTAATTIAMSPAKNGQSGLIIDLGDDDIPVEIEINDRSVRPTVEDGKALILLEPYREYEVSLRAGGDRLMRVEMEQRKVALYPGNIARLDWKAMPVFVVVGQAVLPDQSAVANSRITNLDEFSTTDEAGWFQVELASMQTLRFKTLEGSECQVTLPGDEPPPEEHVVVLDRLLCEPVSANLRNEEGTSSSSAGQ